MAATCGSEPNELAVTHLAALLRLLADETRLCILQILSAGERNVGSLGKELKLTQPTVSHHLGLLRTHRVVVTRRMGKQIFYSLNGRMDVNSGGLTIKTQQFDVRIGPRLAAGD